jgi:glycerophosphoryl diester phosphodiesterase
MFISFNHNICEMLKQINRNTNIAYLIWHEKKINFLFPSLLKKKIKSHINSKHNIDIEYRLLNKWIVKQFHSNALKVNVWTIDKEKQIRKLIKWGVDFITTNKCFNM